MLPRFSWARRCTGSPSSRSHRCTVRMPRPRYAAISFQESSRPSRDWPDPGVGCACRVVVHEDVSIAQTHAKTRHAVCGMSLRLSSRKVAPHTGPAFNTGRSSRRCIVKKLFVVLIQRRAAHQHRCRGAVEARIPSRRMADRGSDDHGTGCPHHRDPRAQTELDHPHGQALQPGRRPRRRTASNSRGRDEGERRRVAGRVGAIRRRSRHV